MWRKAFEKKGAGVEDRCKLCLAEHGACDCPSTETYSHPAWQLSPGSTLHDSRYVIGKAIAQGGFGIGYYGFDTLLKRRVFIKELFPKEYLTRDSAVSKDVYVSPDRADRFEYERSRFLREARTLASFDEIQGIIKVYETFQENNTAYFVGELIVGGSLKRFIQDEGILSWREAFELLRPVAGALWRMHEQSIIHRDLSPDNILMRKTGWPVISDLGAARSIEDSGPLSIIYKKGYAPIEQLAGSEDQGTWTDVYGFFCLHLFQHYGCRPSRRHRSSARKR